VVIRVTNNPRDYCPRVRPGPRMARRRGRICLSLCAPVVHPAADADILQALSGLVAHCPVGEQRVGNQPTVVTAVVALMADAFGKAAFAGNFKLMYPGGVPPHGELSALQQAKRGGFCHWHSAGNDGNVGVRSSGPRCTISWRRALRADLLKQHVALPTH
jgi:hypothetical protein